MVGGTVVRLAMSLDGYIADHAGGYGWIQPVASPGLDTEHQVTFDEVLAGADVVVMGRRCYDQGQHEPFGELGRPVLVASRTRTGSDDTVAFTSDPVREVSRLAHHGARCLLFGGGELVASLLAVDAVDEITVGVVPVILGSGRPLFRGGHAPRLLRLVDCTVESGKVRLFYARRNSADF